MKQQIEELIKRNKISKMKFYEAIGMTPKGFNQSLENNSMKVATLKKIADVLGVPIGYFFEESNKNDNSEIVELLRENRELRKEIDNLRQTLHSTSKRATPEISETKKEK